MFESKIFEYAIVSEVIINIIIGGVSAQGRCDRTCLLDPKSTYLRLLQYVVEANTH
jgi:hypothetical protein